MVHIIGTSLHARIWRLALLACCMLAGLVAVLAWTQELALEANARVEHTHEVRVVLGAYGRAYLDAETGQRGYLLTQKADYYLLPYQQALAGNKALLAQLRALLGNDFPPATLRDLAAVFDDKLQEIAQTVQLAQVGNMAGALALVRAGRGRHDTLKFQQLSAQIAATENGLLAVRQAAAQQEEARVLGIVGVGGLLAVIFILAAARQTVIRIEAPLGDLLEGMAALAQGDLQRRVRWQSQDEISQVVAAFNDMAKRLAAANLARSRSDALVASSMDAIISKDLDGIVTSWNPAAERMFGYSAPEMLGHKLTRLIPPDRVGEETQILATVRAGGTLEHFETVRRRKNGELFSISVSRAWKFRRARVSQPSPMCSTP
jgi:PAS domain S-box-containing protein